MQPAAIDPVGVEVRFLTRKERAPNTWSAHGLLLCGLLLLGSAAQADSREALQKAAMLVQQGRLEEADAQARLALADPDTRAIAYSVLGTIRVHQKRLADSALLLQKAIRLEPHLLGAHLTLAQVYTLQGKSRLAREMFDRALVLDPSNATARLALAQSEMESGHYRRSLELAKRRGVKAEARSAILKSLDAVASEE